MKKLEFNLDKETIESLNDQEMGRIAGGEVMFSSRLFCDSNCERCQPPLESTTAPAESKQPDDTDMPNCPQCALDTPRPTGIAIDLYGLDNYVISAPSENLDFN